MAVLSCRRKLMRRVHASVGGTPVQESCGDESNDGSNTTDCVVLHPEDLPPVTVGVSQDVEASTQGGPVSSGIDSCDGDSGSAGAFRAAHGEGTGKEVIVGWGVGGGSSRWAVLLI